MSGVPQCSIPGSIPGSIHVERGPMRLCHVPEVRSVRRGFSDPHERFQAIHPGPTMRRNQSKRNQFRRVLPAATTAGAQASRNWIRRPRSSRSAGKLMPGVASISMALWWSHGKVVGSGFRSLRFLSYGILCTNNPSAGGSLIYSIGSVIRESFPGCSTYADSLGLKECGASDGSGTSSMH